MYVCMHAPSMVFYVCVVFLREMFGFRMDVENMFLWRQFEQKCLDIRRWNDAAENGFRMKLQRVQ